MAPPQVAVRGTFTPAPARRPAVGARLARTLGRAIGDRACPVMTATSHRVQSSTEQPTRIWLVSLREYCAGTVQRAWSSADWATQAFGGTRQPAITGAQTPCDLFDIPSTSPWTDAAIIVQ